jgi:leader peptidase (prepilin peptidase) / N-methyltransferase
MPVWPLDLLSLYTFAVGAVVGSFLNVVIHRLPRGLSVVHPRSACPHCGAPIRWYDNVPLLSFLLLRARCRDCRAPIAVRYPLVEALAGAAAVLALSRYGLSVTAAEVALFAWMSIALGLIDLEHQLLPDVITYPAIVVGVAGSWLGGFARPLPSLIGVAVGAALPALIILSYRFLRGEEGMGWGDVKYLAAIGAVVGVRDCLWVLVLAAVAGALVGGALWLSGRGSGKTALPFGTFLAAAVLVWLYLPVAWREAVASLSRVGQPG